MRHLHSIIIVIAALAIASCSAKPAKVSGFDLKMSDIRSTKATITIEPGNPDAYYCYGIINSDMDTYFKMSDLENAQFQLDFSVEMWDHVSSFASLFCYRGTQKSQYTYLTPDIDYRVIVYQVNPDTQQLVGTPSSISFHTKPLAMSDISFSFKFEADKLTITPSNDDEYYWDYILTEDLEAEYADAELYYHQLLLMYEEYGFMDLEGATDHGTVEWVFSRDDEGAMEEGKTYTLVASGYENGEINSDLTIVQFVYHKDKPCEQIIPQD